MLRTTLVILLMASVLYILSSPVEGYLDVLFTSDAVELEIEAVHGVYDSSVNSLPLQLDGKIRVNSQGMSAEQVRARSPQMTYLDSTAFADPETIELMAVTDDMCKACFLKGFFSRLGGVDVEDLPGHHVGYLHDAHLDVAKSMLRSCSILTRCIGFKKLTVQQAIAELEKPNQVDAMFYFGNALDPRLGDLHKTKLTVLNMRKLDKDIIKIVLPTARMQDFDVRLTFKNVADLGQPIHSLPAFNNVLYRASAPPQKYNYLHTLVIQRFAKNDNELNYLVATSPLPFKKSPTIASDLRSSRASSIELYMDAGSMQMTFMPTVDIAGYFDTKTNTFEYESDTLEGTPLHIGDIIILRNQDSSHENGQYFVKAIISGKTMMKLLHFRDDRKEESKDDTYYCVTNPGIKFKNECLDTVDHTGRIKQPDVWDAPCTLSHECPFFQQDPATKAYRGGCKDGYCEMPIGTKLVGYKTYSGKPICKGCPRDMLECCDHQKHPVYYYPN